MNGNITKEGILYTCFFSAYDKQGEFESIGKATFKIKEIIEYK